MKLQKKRKNSQRNKNEGNTDKYTELTMFSNNCNGANNKIEALKGKR